MERQECLGSVARKNCADELVDMCGKGGQSPVFEVLLSNLSVTPARRRSCVGGGGGSITVTAGRVGEYDY